MCSAARHEYFSGKTNHLGLAVQAVLQCKFMNRAVIYVLTIIYCTHDLQIAVTITLLAGGLVYPIILAHLNQHKQYRLGLQTRHTVTHLLWLQGNPPLEGSEVFVTGDIALGRLQRLFSLNFTPADLLIL